MNTPKLACLMVISLLGFSFSFTVLPMIKIKDVEKDIKKLGNVFNFDQYKKGLFKQNFKKYADNTEKNISKLKKDIENIKDQENANLTEEKVELLEEKFAKLKKAKENLLNFNLIKKNLIQGNVKETDWAREIQNVIVLLLRLQKTNLLRENIIDSYAKEIQDKILPKIKSAKTVEILFNQMLKPIESHLKVFLNLDE